MECTENVNKAADAPSGLNEELCVNRDIVDRLRDSQPEGTSGALLLNDAANEIERLREALKTAANELDEAAEDVADWGLYATEYFQQKHKLDDDVKKYKEAALMLRILAERIASEQGI